MFKIQTLNEIDPKGLSLLSPDSYEASSEIENPDAIVLRSHKMHGMELPPSLKAVARAGAGVNNIPIDECTEKGIVVFNTPGANANGVKEMVIAGLMLASRDIIDGAIWVRSLIGKGSKVPAIIEKGKKNFVGQEIKGKTLAVIGLGAIGVLVANAAKSLGMEVVGYDPYISVDQALKLSNRVNLVKGIEELLAQADYVTLNIPLTPDTKGYIDKEKLKMMKDNVRILNFARGGLVNIGDLREAIASGKVAKYITDFPDEEILNLDKTIAIPHLAASTKESETNCAVMAVKQMKDFLENGNITNSVNFPTAIMERHEGCRILIANKNIPNMVSQISSILASQTINIDSMLNRKYNGNAYNIIDITRKTLDPSIVEKLKEIDGVSMVRVLPAT
ncbi:MAG TPA: 3-phosphoglycerate dehydrogenase family protein [Dysgonamonadaceae bacterium]|nr:3-phosphoglycerate dehydrogenase family protein [Dysgonamonadaceae bacterium]